MTSKQRANLRGMISAQDSIFQIGKNDLTDNVIKAVNDALEARELVKLTVLKGSELTPAEAAKQLSRRTSSEIVCTIGSKLVLYRRSKAKDFKHLEF